MVGDKFDYRVFQVFRRETQRARRRLVAQGGEDARWVQTHALRQVYQQVEFILLALRRSQLVPRGPFLDRLNRMKSCLLQRRRQFRVAEDRRKRLSKLDCSRTRLRFARELGFHLAVTPEEKGLPLLRQLGERRLVFRAPVFRYLIASRRRGN